MFTDFGDYAKWVCETVKRLPAQTVKPRIKQERDRFVCAGDYVFGYGDTPAAAYSSWQAIREVLGSARAQRMANGNDH